jgi:hypothetical protein
MLVVGFFGEKGKPTLLVLYNNGFVRVHPTLLRFENGYRTMGISILPSPLSPVNNLGAARFKHV